MDYLRCREEDYKNERDIMDTVLANLPLESLNPLLWEDFLLEEVQSWRTAALKQMDANIVSPYDYSGKLSDGTTLQIEIKARFITYDWISSRRGADRGIFIGFDKFLEMAVLGTETGVSFYVVNLNDCIVVYKFTAADAAQVYANGLEVLRLARDEFPAKGYSKYIKRLAHILSLYKGRWPKLEPKYQQFRVEPGRRRDRLTGAVDAAGEENRVTVIVPIDKFVVASKVPANVVNAHPSLQ